LVVSHFRQGLAAHAGAALEVGLGRGEVDCAAGEGAFLEDPAAFVEGAGDYVGLEVVEGSSDVEGVVSTGQVEGDEVPAAPWREESAGCSGSATRGNYAVGEAEDGFHEAGFGVEVAGRTLDDADCVDPEVADSESAGDDDGITERGREVWNCDAVLDPRGDVFTRCAEVVVM